MHGVSAQVVVSFVSVIIITITTTRSLRGPYTMSSWSPTLLAACTASGLSTSAPCLISHIANVFTPSNAAHSVLALAVTCDVFDAFCFFEYSD